MRDTLPLIWKRKELLEKLGGLPEPTVSNREWLYLFKEDTRHSIQIEGFFTSEKQLEEVLLGGYTRAGGEEAYNYFRAASFAYGLAYECYREEKPMFGTRSFPR